MKKFILSNLIFFLVLLNFVSNGLAQNQEPIKRDIVVFYNEKADKDAFFTNVHQSAEVILNHLGYRVLYHKANAPLPDKEELKNVHGIFTWFTNEVVFKNPVEYCTWLDEQLDHGKKLVIWGSMGTLVPSKRRSPLKCQRVLHRLGADYKGEFSDNPFFFNITKKDSKMVEFERKLLLSEGLYYSKIVPSADAKVYLTISRTDMEESASAMVLTTPRGGYAHPGYILYQNKDIDKRHWRINPFLFFKEAFDTDGLPMPDTNSIFGERIFYAHVDGDGIFNVSQIDRESFSGEIIQKEVFAKFPSLPTTASIITGYFDLPRFSGKRADKLYADIFSLPNIESGNHAHAHPLKWRQGTVALKIPGYKFSSKLETTESIQKQNHLLKELHIPKTTILYQWTGDCLPSADQIRLLNKENFLNMNGGDSRFDIRYDSYGFLYPLGLIRAPDAFQIYSSASNENTYTQNWTSGFFRFANVIKTYKRTEDPIRIKPINIYYHYYGGERVASLKGIKEAYEYAKSLPVFAMFASRYARIVDDFFSLTLFKTANNGFVVKNKGHLRTIRFENENRHVDLKKSQGIMGYKHFQNGLLVHLDESKEHSIVLTNKAAEQVYIQSATFDVKNWKAQKNHIQFSKHGWNNSQIVLAGLAPLSAYKIKSNEGEQKLTSDAKGTLKITFNDFEGTGPYRDVEVMLTK
ncbi:MAG: hypothetical protein H7A33_01890 [Deltaproteobacteria bacterium]|nr:hypothetical protein [Deltaproteobacteria bacterium]